MFYVTYEHFPVDNVFFIRVLKYDFPIFPSPWKWFWLGAKPFRKRFAKIPEFPGFPESAGEHEWENMTS